VEREISADYRIQPADPETLELLPVIEVAAAGIFSPEDIAPELRQEGLPVARFEQAARKGRVWTAVTRSSGRPVGFALAAIVDGSAHLYEMDVQPDHGQRGLGTALVRAVVEWARRQGFSCVTLTTFRHLPWNGPFYHRLGFEELSRAELTPGLAQHLEQEAQHGLDRSKRVAMRLDLRVP
jgi:GNAT superfamily N-acetyltransferase